MAFYLYNIGYELLSTERKHGSQCFCHLMDKNQLIKLNLVQPALIWKPSEYFSEQIIIYEANALMISLIIILNQEDE